MEFVEEPQVLPLVLSAVLSFILMAGVYGLLLWSRMPPAQANLWYWYLARGAGFTSYVILTAAVLLGTSISSRLWDRWHARATASLMHQFLSLMVWPFLAIHLWFLHLDTSVVFRYADLFLPFRATYRPLATSMGILAMYGLLVLLGSSLARSVIGHRMWRLLHYISIPAFLAASLHGLMAGSDSRLPWAHGLYVLSLGLFAVAVWPRLASSRAARRTRAERAG